MPKTRTEAQRLAYNARQKIQRRRRQNFDYDGQLIKQEGVCASCGDPPPEERQFHRDHNHTTGADRELLCGPCNLALGLLKEDPVRIQRLLDYIKKHTPT